MRLRFVFCAARSFTEALHYCEWEWVGCGGCCRVPGCCSHATKSACFLGKRSGAKSRCRAAPWGGCPASSLQEVLWEQRGPGLESCQLLVMLVEWEPKSHLSFMDSADTCGIHLTMHWWRTRRERDGKPLYDTSGSQRVDYRDGHTNEALAPPHNKGFDWGSWFHSNVNTIWLCGHNLWEWSEFLTVSPSGATSDIMNRPEQKWITSFFRTFVTTKFFYNNMTQTLTMIACVECDEVIRYSNVAFFLYEP